MCTLWTPINSAFSYARLWCISRRKCAKLASQQYRHLLRQRPSLESAEAFSDRLNETLGVDRTACSALAERVFAVKAYDGRTD